MALARPVRQTLFLSLIEDETSSTLNGGMPLKMGRLHGNEDFSVTSSYVTLMDASVTLL